MAQRQIQSRSKRPVKEWKVWTVHFWNGEAYETDLEMVPNHIRMAAITYEKEMPEHYRNGTVVLEFGETIRPE